MESLSTLSQFGNIGVETMLLILLKLFFIVGGLMYLLFSFVIVRQIAIMKKTLMTPLSPLVTTLGYAHLVFSLAVLIFFFLLF